MSCCISIDNGPEVMTEEIRKARKAHRCCECGGKIAPSDTYEYVKGLWDGDWSEFKTLEYYGWAEESDKILTRFDKERIEKSFGEEFRQRGFTIVEDGGDMIVTLFIVVKQKTTQTATTSSMGGMYGGYYGGYYGYGPGYGFSPWLWLFAPFFGYGRRF